MLVDQVDVGDSTLLSVVAVFEVVGRGHEPDRHDLVPLHLGHQLDQLWKSIDRDIGAHRVLNDRRKLAEVEEKGSGVGLLEESFQNAPLPEHPVVVGVLVACP